MSQQSAAHAERSCSNRFLLVNKAAPSHYGLFIAQRNTQKITLHICKMLPVWLLKWETGIISSFLV